MGEVTIPEFAIEDFRAGRFGPPPSQEVDIEELRRQLLRVEAQATAAESFPNRLPRAPLAGPFLQGVEQAGAQASGNLLNAGRGLTNTALSIINQLGQPGALGPQGPVLSPGRSQAIEQDVQARRERGLLTEQLLQANRDVNPGAALGGDALSFLTEVVLTGPQFSAGKAIKAATTTKDVIKAQRTQLFGRSAQEALIGSAFGASEIAVSDEDKARIVTYGLLTGAITPSLFHGVKRVFGGDTVMDERIKLLLQQEEDLGAVGLLALGELTGHRGLRKLEAALDNIPFFGLGKKRDVQREEIRHVADSLATRITGRTDAAEEDLVEAIQAQYQRNKDVVDAKFKVVDDLIDQIPRDAFGIQRRVGLPSYRRRAAELLQREVQKAAGTKDEELIKFLRKAVAQPALSFRGARDSLSTMMENVRVERRAAANQERNRTTLGALTSLQTALVRDTEDFAEKQGGELLDAWKDAKQSFKDLLLPYHRAPVIRDTFEGFDEFDIDAVTTSIIKGTAPRRSGKIVDLLEPDGQDTARYLVIRHAFDGAMEGNFVNGVKFMNNLNRLRSAWGTTFTPQQKTLLEAYVGLTNEARRAFSRENAIGPLVTGGAASALVGGGMFATGSSAEESAAGGLATALTSILGARFLLGTKTGREILLLSHRARTNKESLAALQMAERALTRWAEANLPSRIEALSADDPESFTDSFGPT